MEEKKDYEMVQHPNHYKGKKYECFDVMEDIGLDKDFYLGSAFKYLWRAGKKPGNELKQDLEKAIVYIQKRIEGL